MESIIVELIACAGTIIASWLMVRKSLHDKDLQMAKTLQQYEDRIAQLEKQQKEYHAILSKVEVVQDTQIGIKKDIEYLKEFIKEIRGKVK